MALRWLVILVLLVLLFVGYLATLNAVPVKVVIPFFGEFTPTSGFLMILAFFLGIVASLVFFAVRDWQEYFRRLTEDKRRRLTAQARERLQRARNLLQIGLPDAAQASLRDALDKDPELAEAHELAGDLAAGKSDFYGAAASHNQALSLDPDNDAVRWKLSRDYLGAGNVAMARKSLRDGLERSERNVYLLARQRDLLVELGDWDGAIGAQNRLARIRDYRSGEDPRQFLAGLHFEKGKALLERKQHDEAVRTLEEAVKLDPQLSLAYIRTGDAYLAQGKDKMALKIWALGYRRTDDPAILTRLEEHYLAHGDPSRIINLYLRHIEEKPQETRLRLQFAALLFKLEMLQEAQNQIEEIRRLQGEDNADTAYLSSLLRRKLDDGAGMLADLTFLVERCLPKLGGLTCSACRRPSPVPVDRCPGCGRWGTVRKGG